MTQLSTDFYKKLDKKKIEDILALTPMQEGMLSHYLKEAGNDRYAEHLYLDISGAIDINRFEQAWNIVIKTNEMLRTVYRWENVEYPVQIILKNDDFKPVFYDLTAAEKNDAEKELEYIKNRQKNEIFDLRDLSFRVTLCKYRQNRYMMIVSNHHICYDGWSSGIILKEFLNAYNDLSNNMPVKPGVKTTFKEFVKWLQTQDKTRQKVFWKEYLYDFNPQKVNPIVPGKEKGKGEMGNITIQFSSNLVKELNAFIRKKRITSAALFNGTWAILLRKYTHNEDIVFGTTVSGRKANIKGIKDMVGLFINTVPLRTKVTGDKKVLSLLEEVQHSMQVREEYESTSLVDIKDFCGIDFKETIFDSIVVIENYPIDRDRMLTDKNNALSIHSYWMPVQADVDLIVNISIDSGIDITFSYTKSLFLDETIEKMGRHFEWIVKKILETPGNKDLEIKNIELVEEAQKMKVHSELKDDINGVSVDFDFN